MNVHAVSAFSLLALLSVSSNCPGDQNPDAAGVANDVAEMQKQSDAKAIDATPEVQKPSATGAKDVAGATDDKPMLQKPDEAESIAAAITYLNRDGQMTIQKSEFLAWGTYSEKQVYWPMKLRLTYKKQGSDALRQNDYAVKISRDSNGKLNAGPYYAWRTDFK